MSRTELLCISICREDVTLLLQPVSFPMHEALHSLGLSDFVAPLPINSEQGAVSRVT